MTRYATTQQLLEALRQAPKGKSRAEILSPEENRRLIYNSGANVTLYCGKLQNGKTFREKLSGIYLGLLERQNAKSGIREGIGALGGLSERIDEAAFNRLSLDEQESLIGLKDDVIRSKDNLPQHIGDIGRISRNTVKRESFEELGNLGIYDFPIDVDKMKPLDMSEVRDDNYAINIWNGYGQVWAVTPYCYRLEVPESMLDRLHEASLCQKHEKNSEARSYLKMTLFDALPRYGKRSGEVLSADGRDMTYDYRYPHEWLVSWKIAAEALNGEPKDLLLLAAEVQKTSEHQVSFAAAAKDMGQDLDFVAKALELPADTVRKMEGNFQAGHRQKFRSSAQSEK